MTTQTEALKLALVALDIVKIHYTQNRHVNEAITAIKEALNSPNGEAQPEQLNASEHLEPVASGVIRTLVSIDKNGVETWKEEPFYTAPPQRTWLGLTDEDVRQCSQDVVAGGKENCVDRFAYAIEAKLKEKNERKEKNT